MQLKFISSNLKLLDILFSFVYLVFPRTGEFGLAYSGRLGKHRRIQHVQSRLRGAEMGYNKFYEKNVLDTCDKALEN